MLAIPREDKRLSIKGLADKPQLSYYCLMDLRQGEIDLCGNILEEATIAPKGFRVEREDETRVIDIFKSICSSARTHLEKMRPTNLEH